MKQNKLLHNTLVKNSTIQPLGTFQREHLDQQVLEELNTYKNFGIFATWNDVTDLKYKDGTAERDSKTPAGTPGVRSLFNKSSAVLTGDPTGMDLKGKENQSKAIEELVMKATEFRLSNNIPLIDTPENRKKQRQKGGITVKELVDASKAGLLGRGVYSYADFMYCKHLGRIPNNHLITLRRYPIPVNDAMLPIGFGKTRKEKAGRADVAVPIGTMVTWLGVSGNEFKNILSYDYAMAFEEKTAGWNEVNSNGGGQNGILNKMEAAINPATRAMYNNGTNVPAMGAFSMKFFKFGKIQGDNGPYDYVGDKHLDENKLYGPIDRVKKIYYRSDAGLEWNQKFSIVFEYELKAYNGINPRSAMLDLLANILAVTYTTGNFWGGGYRGGGIRQSSAFSNLQIFKKHGSFTSFMDAFSADVQTGKSGIKSFLETSGGPVEAIKKVANIIGGMLMGSLLNKLGRPARYTANSLLVDQPVAFWHITIGNPWHPIMTMGNMVLKNTKIEHDGPLGLDDFPTRLTVTCEFERGRVRDIAGTERLYMGGNDRIFHSMSQKIMDMYAASYEYKYGSSGAEIGAITKKSDEIISAGDQGETGVKLDGMDMEEPKNALAYLQEVFGDYDTKAVMWASREQAEGAFKQKKETEENKGDKNNKKSN